MRTKIAGMIMLLGIMFVPVARSQQGPGGCTNYGCKEITFMSQALPDYSHGCVMFEVPTGRKVRNSTNDQGGDPVSLGGTQIINFRYDSCATCTPPPLNSIAIDGFSPGPIPAYIGSFGRYECPLIVIDPDIPGGPYSKAASLDRSLCSPKLKCVSFY